MPKSIEMEISGRVKCFCPIDVKKLSKRRRLVKSASPCPTSSKDGYFPDWCLIEVLSRLPIKVVFRCKSVSRQWFSLISDPSFAHFYNVYRASVSALALSKLVPYCPPWVFIYKRMFVDGNSKLSQFPVDKLLEIIYSPGNSTSPNYHVLHLPNSKEVKGEKYFIQAVDNGFVLYSWYQYNDNSDNHIREYYICNPLTKQWFPLPQQKYGSRPASAGFITQVDAGSLKSYKLALIHCSPMKQNFLEFEVYSFEMREWVEYTVDSRCKIQVSSRKKPVLLNGYLHWEDYDLGVIAYDPYNSPNKFRLIKFPSNVYKKNTRGRYSLVSSMCGVHQGYIKYFQVTHLCHPQSGFTHFKIWVLEDYSSERWHLQHAVANKDIVVGINLYHRGASSTLVCFHPYDAEVVYLEWVYDVVSYNIRTRKLEALGIPHDLGKNCRFIVVGCWLCFPLVLPLWPVYIPPSLIPVYRRS